MTNQQAAAKAKKRWGKRAAWQNRGHFSSPERRATASQVTREARAEIERIEQEIKERIKGLDWYQELRKQQRDQREQIKGTGGYAFFYRFTVGTSDGMFFHVLGQGDTWEEAFAEADKKGQ